uniref:Cytochrome c domain-containing protein n=1 Tax=Thermodesulfobacterium geofontis TaxID=1295609 RepID=A0A7V4N3C9_9BACT
MEKFIMGIILIILFIGSLIIFNGYSKDVYSNPAEEKPKDFKCLKCHKGSKSLENMITEKNITSAEDLRVLIRKGPKSGLHITVPEEDLEKAIQYLDLK